MNAYFIKMRRNEMTNEEFNEHFNKLKRIDKVLNVACVITFAICVAILLIAGI